eukprot:s282_g2.t1
MYCAGLCCISRIVLQRYCGIISGSKGWKAGRSLLDKCRTVPRMSGNYLELFWALLENKDLEQLRSSVPDDFDWSVRHPTRKTTVLIEAFNKFPKDPKQEAHYLNLIEWLVKAGANYSQKSGTSSFCCSRWKTGDEPDQKMEVSYTGHSALSYIAAWNQQFKGKDIWQPEVCFFAKVVNTISKASSQRQSTRHRVVVDEGILENWEKFLHATESHDLTIEAADGCVTAHAQMLKEASPVVQAMLGSPMKEREAQQIQLSDTSSSAVRLVLETLYTCSSQGDPDYKTALSALDLAHRWQMEVVVAILSDLVAELITAESFAAIAEHAALKNLDTLKKACQSFGSQNVAIQAQVKKGATPAGNPKSSRVKELKKAARSISAGIHVAGSFQFAGMPHRIPTQDRNCSTLSVKNRCKLCTLAAGDIHCDLFVMSMIVRPEPEEEAIAMAHSDQLTGMMLFQFNPHLGRHWECFKPQNAEGCGRHAMALVTELLQRHDVDLANVVELPESYKPPKGWSMNCRPGGGGETTCIIWRSNRWEVIGPSTECWFGRGRSCNVMMLGYAWAVSVLAATFEHVASKFKVTLAGAHFPHGAGTSWYSEFMGILGMNLHKSKNVTEKVIILADSNAGLHQKSDFSILTETGVLLPNVKAPQMWTCCNNIGYHGFFDRIIANFGSKLELVKDEVYEKQSNGYKSTPAFARVNLPNSGTWGEYHQPILGYLSLAFASLWWLKSRAMPFAPKVQPVYSHKKWEEHYQKSGRHLKNCCAYPVITRMSRGSSAPSVMMQIASDPAAASGAIPGSGAPSSVQSPVKGGASTSVAPEEEDHRFVLKEGLRIGETYYLLEMSTDGRTLNVSAYDGESKTSLELVIKEKVHRQLYRECNGDYAQIAAMLRVDGSRLILDSPLAQGG